MTQRRSPECFDIPVEKIRNGYFSDTYFIKTSDILRKDGYHPRVMMQIFQRKNAILCGMDEALAIIQRCAYHPESLVLHALHDGDELSPWETVLTIEGDLADFSHLETVYLGVLARQSKIATHVREVVRVANNKPVLFFPSRFDHYSVQEVDGYAAYIGGAQGVSTIANAQYGYDDAIGTIPHALIATYGGDTLRATNAFHKHIDPQVNRVALVDFDNNCVETSLTIARALGDSLWGVRLDTSDALVDASVIPYMSTFKPTGVCPQLVRNVRRALDDEGFSHVKIVVSGGFNSERIQQFEREKTPVDVYAVGSSLFEKENINFTADIVMVNNEECAKFGRQLRPNPKLELIK